MSKVLPLSEAIRTHVSNNDTVFVGGFGQCIPFAAAHEIVRQNLTGLTLCRSGADILFDLLIAAGVVSKVIVGFIGNPGVGLNHALRRAVEAGEVQVEDWTNFTMVLRLRAAAMGLPFLPTATLDGGDIKERLHVATIKCPYTDEPLTAVPSLAPDVALVHAKRSDQYGNLQCTGLIGDTVEGAMASKRIVATTEEIVSDETLRQHRDQTIIPGFRVSSVSQVPWGAYPSYVDGIYSRDDAAYYSWDGLSKDPQALSQWIQAEIRELDDFADYISRIDPSRLSALKEAMQSAKPESAT